MTTLSTLIGPSGSGLLSGGAAGARPSLWQRLFRKSSHPAGSRPAAHDVAASADALARMSEEEAADLLSGQTMTLGRDGEASDAGSMSDSVDELPRAEFGGGGPLLPPTPPRRRLLWGNARRDAAIDEVKNGLSALASLLGGIQQHMESQGARQEELITHLAQLPKNASLTTESIDALREQVARAEQAQTASLASIREQLAAGTESQAGALGALRDTLGSAMQTLGSAADTQNGTLVAIRDQIEQGAANQARLCSALERLGGLQETAGEALTSIAGRIDQMDARDAAFISSLEKVSGAMQTVSRASEASAVVLDRVEGSLATREAGIHKTLDRHQGKFNALMAVAIAVSAAAMAVVAGVGYLVLTKAG